jgi:predicted nucleic acid-binding protein
MADFALEIATRYKIRGADALFVATSYRYSAELVTLDAQQRRRGGEVVNIRDIGTE